MQRGTLFQLRNLLNRRNVKKSCKDAVDPCEDFLETVVTVYILEAVMDILGMSTTEDDPCSELFPQDTILDKSSH